jgi:GNAT superfamily N-acetyltransferase
MTTSHSEIEKNIKIDRPGLLNFELRVPEENYLTAFYYRRTNLFVVSYVYVEPGCRRRGIGSALLRQCLSEARVAGASALTAHIVSRESLDMFTSVLDGAGISVQKVGGYLENPLKVPDDTIADVEYEL